VEIEGKKSNRRLVVVPCTDPGAEIELEVYSAQERSDLLAETLGVEVRIADAPDDADAPQGGPEPGVAPVPDSVSGTDPSPSS
jgi:hypothetical protein